MAPCVNLDGFYSREEANLSRRSSEDTSLNLDSRRGTWRCSRSPIARVRIEHDRHRTQRTILDSIARRILKTQSSRDLVSMPAKGGRGTTTGRHIPSSDVWTDGGPWRGAPRRPPPRRPRAEVERRGP